MFENNRKRSSLKSGQLKPFELNKDEKKQQHHFEDISSNNKENIFNGKSINRIGSTNDQFDSHIYNISNAQKSLKGERYGVDPGVIDNFTSPEPYPFYLHPSNSDLSNPSSSETYNRAGSKNYFVSETPTPFLYNDIVNKGRRTDTTKKNKPTIISNRYGNNTTTTTSYTQNTTDKNSIHAQKFYSNSYGLSSVTEQDIDEDENDNEAEDLPPEMNLPTTQSIWSVSPPFSATRTDDTNLDTVIEEETEPAPRTTENSIFQGKVVESSNIEHIYDQEEPITYHNDYSEDSSYRYRYDTSSKDTQNHLTNNNPYFATTSSVASSSSSSSLKHKGSRSSLTMFNTNPSTNTLPKAKSSSSIDNPTKKTISVFSHSRSLTSPAPSFSLTKSNKNIMKNNIYSSKNNSSDNTKRINNSNSNQPFSSTSKDNDNKSIIGNYYNLMGKNKKISTTVKNNSRNDNNGIRRRFQTMNYTATKKQKISNSDNVDAEPEDEFYCDSDQEESTSLNPQYQRNSVGFIERISLFFYKILNLLMLCFYAIWKLFSSKFTIIFLLVCIYSQLFLIDENGDYSIRRWLKWAKLPEQDVHHQKIKSLEDQISKLEGMLMKLNQETEAIQADTPQAYLEQLNKEIEQLSVRLAHVAEEASQSSIINSKQKQEIINLKHLSSNIEVNFNDLKTNVEDFHEIIKHVETKIDADKEQQIQKLKEALEPLLEKIIPQMMIAKINPVTHAIEFDERFWRYLSKNFLTIDSLKSLIKTHDEALEEMKRRVKLNIPTWEDFIDSNRQMLENYIRKEFQEQLQQGDIIISKEDVMSLVQSEFHGYLTQLNTAIPELYEAIQGYIQQALERYAIDIASKPDYALESSGAQVLSSFTSDSYHRNPESGLAKAWANLFGMSGVLLGKSPVVALQPDTHAGNCWAMDGDHGFLTIQLSVPIIPSHITIEHISQEESVPDSLLSSAPREIEVYGVTDQIALEQMAASGHHSRDNLSVASSPYAIHLASIVFDPRDSFIQTFPISNEGKIRLSSVTSIPVIQFQIHSNWGESKYTCLYRVRVHGREPTLPKIVFSY